MSDIGQCMMILIALDDEDSWNTKGLQKAIREIQNLVNECTDITGILTAGLIADYWGDFPVITFWVQHDERYDDFNHTDSVTVELFEKAIELSGYENDLWVLDEEERKSLNTNGRGDDE